MEVRSRVAGEGFRPYAMKGTRKLKDIMNQLKVPPAERGLWPIIADREGIVWVPGFRPSHKMKRAEGPVIRITITPPIL
jgi:tRNA(Ile)-lysidine synthase